MQAAPWLLATPWKSTPRRVMATVSDTAATAAMAIADMVTTASLSASALKRDHMASTNLSLLAAEITATDVDMAAMAATVLDSAAAMATVSDIAAAMAATEKDGMAAMAVATVDVAMDVAMAAMDVAMAAMAVSDIAAAMEAKDGMAAMVAAMATVSATAEVATAEVAMATAMATVSAMAKVAMAATVLDVVLEDLDTVLEESVDTVSAVATAAKAGEHISSDELFELQVCYSSPNVHCFV